MEGEVAEGWDRVGSGEQGGEGLGVVVVREDEFGARVVEEVGVVVVSRVRGKSSGAVRCGLGMEVFG